MEQHLLIERFVREKLEENSKGAHTFDHTLRVYELSVRIGKKM